MLSDFVVTTAGLVFVISNRSGDIQQGTLQGLFASDTRFLSRYLLLVNGQEPVFIGGANVDHSVATFYGNSPGARDLPAGSISIVRDRYVSHGLHEDISLFNHSLTTCMIRLELIFDADFADIFDVRGGPGRRRRRTIVETKEGQHLVLVYRRGQFRRETWVTFSPEPVVHEKTATFDLVLESGGTQKICVTVLPVLEPSPPPVECVEGILGPPFGAYRRRETLHQGPPLKQEDAHGSPEDVPRLETDHIGLRLAYDRAIADLHVLRMEQESGHYILAAGLPWFMAIFGRDSIISAIQTKLLGPELMLGTLHTLANFQATVRDDYRDAQPGKIPHEIRRGELALRGEIPHSRYYGSVDATPLFLVLLWEAYQWTGDEDLLRQMLPSAEAALRWIDRYGDIDRDGFVEYQRQARKGLRNQGWKDSEDSISFADGTLAEGPIALAEVQGYVYDAKRRMAEVYRVLGNAPRARRLDQAARRLRERFNEAFWMPQKGYYAVALDGRKRQVDSITSNPGHCLWSGIIDQDRAPVVAQRLMEPDMFSGWGIRTLSTEMARYNPLSYHNGSVWPHDNSIIAAGLVRYGLTREANELTLAVVDAATAFPDARLPELFAGYPRREFSFPVPYPAANTPQAWASGTIVFLLETILGVIPTGDQLLLGAPPQRLSFTLTGVRYRGSRLVL